MAIASNWAYHFMSLRDAQSLNRKSARLTVAQGFPIIFNRQEIKLNGWTAIICIVEQMRLHGLP